MTGVISAQSSTPVAYGIQYEEYQVANNGYIRDTQQFLSDNEQCNNSADSCMYAEAVKTLENLSASELNQAWLECANMAGVVREGQPHTENKVLLTSANNGQIQQVNGQVAAVSSDNLLKSDMGPPNTTSVPGGYQPVNAPCGSSTVRLVVKYY